MQICNYVFPFPIQWLIAERFFVRHGCINRERLCFFSLFSCQLHLFYCWRKNIVLFEFTLNPIALESKQYFVFRIEKWRTCEFIRSAMVERRMTLVQLASIAGRSF
ncbi:hypothetical protein KC19_1G106700 [Ceratodon purpureus]|uniref:Uncharacterized protein n=1 Tax=Ceratodon purpureus TaxID=3225 RepID=A0A8T0J3N5_CERPU|nr:hypothetical protein KC19_1G106700 [Ceratodon purpureus]